MIEKYLVKKITEPVDWKVTVPGSKSMTNRALLMAVLSAGTVRVEGVLFSDDSRHFLACLVALGFTVEIEEEKKCVTVTGCGGRIPRGEAVIDVGSAGTAARFLAAMLGFSGRVLPRDPLLSADEAAADGGTVRSAFRCGAKITFLEEEGIFSAHRRMPDMPGG